VVRALRGLRSLTHRGFRLLVGGQFASGVSDAAYAGALPWYVLADHGSTVLLGTVLAAYGVLRTVLIVPGGHGSDRFGPWSVMMAADAVRAVAAEALALLTVAGRAQADLLILVATVLGAGEGVFLAASFAIVPALLPDDQLPAGNALASVNSQLAALLGPGLGGVVVAWAEPASAFALDALSFVVSALTLARIGRQERSRRPVTGGPASRQEPPSGAPLGAWCGAAGDWAIGMPPPGSADCLPRNGPCGSSSPSPWPPTWGWEG
jgi:MFS family permease